MSNPRGLIASKTLVPAVGAGTIERPRVLGTLAEAAEGRRILLVVAPAGSGKTTAVAQLVRARPGPHAWLSLWESDDGPGRFTTYLAAAIAAVDPDAAERTRGSWRMASRRRTAPPSWARSCPLGRRW